MTQAFAFIWNKKSYHSVVLLAISNWTTIYIPLAVMWISIFISNKGIITKLLVNRITVFIGNISAYAFLIHYVITSYTNAAKEFLHLNLSNIENALLICFEFVLTVIVTIVFMKIIKKKVEF